MVEYDKENLLKIGDFMIIFSSTFKDQKYHLDNLTFPNLSQTAFYLAMKFCFYSANSSFLASSKALLFFALQFDWFFYLLHFAFRRIDHFIEVILACFEIASEE